VGPVTNWVCIWILQHQHVMQFLFDTLCINQ
jgi:hypothetical protein